MSKIAFHIAKEKAMLCKVLLFPFMKSSAYNNIQD